MQRRRFLATCAVFSGAAASRASGRVGGVAPRSLRARAARRHPSARPIRLAALAADTNYVFQYPYAATPCFLLNSPGRVAAAGELRRRRRRYGVAGRRRARRQRRRVFGDLRAQARIPDARHLVHPLPEGPVGDVDGERDPLLRRPQRLRPGGWGRASSRVPRRSRSRRSCSSTTRRATNWRTRHRRPRAVRRVLREVRVEARLRVRRQGAQRGRRKRPSCASSRVLQDDDPLLGDDQRRGHATAFRDEDVERAARGARVHDSTPMRAAMSGAGAADAGSAASHPVPSSTISGLCARSAAKSCSRRARRTRGRPARRRSHRAVSTRFSRYSVVPDAHPARTGAGHDVGASAPADGIS